MPVYPGARRKTGNPYITRFPDDRETTSGQNRG